ncbi:MAG: hypothetical protein IJ600_08245 [Lachnospiraceae bacterium]|nr:hypothetical protein [Lachnospiraceae bacterium]
MKVPEAERSTAMKKTLEETQKQIDRCEHIREAYKYADNVVDMELWCGSDADNRKLFRDMYLAAEGLGEDHPYVQQLKLIGEGRSGIYPEYDLEKGQQGTIAATQTVAELQKAAEILQQSEIHTPAMEQAIAGINKHVDAIRNHHQYRNEQDSFEELMAWAHVTPKQKQNLKDFSETLEKAAGKADLPEDEKRQIKQLQEYAENAAKYKRDPNWYELQNGSEGIQKLKEILPAFIGERGTHHRLYDSAMKVLNDLAPEKAKEAEKAAKQTTKDLKEQLELSEEECVAAQQKLLQQQMDSFEKDLAGFKMMKENLDKVKKSYFRHDNSSLYTNMVNKVNDLCAATGYHEMEQLKAELKQLTTDYLDHTTLKRASSLHPNAETRRLCAFQMLAMTDEETYNKYSADANKLRDKDNQITKERLASIPGVGQPLRNKTSIKEMMAQDAPAKKEHKSHAALQPTEPVADTKITKKV